MNAKLVEDIANAVLYEGYMLYPYRKSAVKNRQRWNFGVLYPPGYDVSSMQIECLCRADSLAVCLRVRVRFLQLIDPHTQEAIARDVVLTCRLGDPVQHDFEFPPIEGSIEITAEQLAPDLYKIRVSILNT